MSRVARVVTPLLALVLLAGCLGTDPEEPSRGALGPVGASGSDPQGGPDGARESAPDQAELRARVQRALDERARAVRDGDEAAFVRQLGGGPRWRARQLTWFRNAVQLPWQRFDYEVLDESWGVDVASLRTREGATTIVPRTVQRTRLQGFDSRVVERTVGFVAVVDDDTPSDGPDAGIGVRLVADRVDGGARLFEGTPAPWELVPVQVRRQGGVLGVFDAASVGSADEVMATVERGVAEVDDALPYDWSGRVVVYAIADRSVLDTFTDVPGGSVDLLGALTFPTYSRPGLSPVASTRMLLLPTSLAAGQPFLGRIVRHELSHVALGSRDDGAPTWFTEGLAEYLGARAVPSAERNIPTEAVRRARQPVDGMPSSSTFNGPDQDWHYALSWMAIDHLAATQGEAVLWRLLDAFGDQRVPDADARGDRVLREVTGIGPQRLARQAAQRITNLYG